MNFKYLTILAFLGVLAALWFAAQDGSVPAIVFLASLGTLILVLVGMFMALYAVRTGGRATREALESNAVENIKLVSAAQRDLGSAMANYNRAVNNRPQLPAGSASPQVFDADAEVARRGGNLSILDGVFAELGTGRAPAPAPTEEMDEQ